MAADSLICLTIGFYFLLCIGLFRVLSEDGNGLIRRDKPSKYLDLFEVAIYTGAAVCSFGFFFVLAYLDIKLLTWYEQWLDRESLLLIANTFTDNGKKLGKDIAFSLIMAWVTCIFISTLNSLIRDFLRDPGDPMSEDDFRKTIRKGVLSPHFMVMIVQMGVVFFLPDVFFGGMYGFMEKYSCGQPDCEVSFGEKVWQAIGLHFQWPGTDDVEAVGSVRFVTAIHSFINKAIEVLLIAMMANTFINLLMDAMQKYRVRRES